jgi:predicted membrane-bound spermidine synthase
MPALRLALYALFALSGFCGLVYESIWSHYLRNYLGHAAHGQTVVLVIFVGGLALGAWLAGRTTARLREPLIAYAIAEIGIGLAALVFHPVFVAFTEWTYDAVLPALCGDSGWCATQWVVAALLIVAPAIALGTTFPWMVAGVMRRFPERPGHEISVLYFMNSIGAVFGVLASAYLFVPRLGLPGTVMLAGALNVAIGLAVMAIAYRRVREPVVEAPPLAVEAKPKGKAARRARAAEETVAAAAPPTAPVAGATLVRTFLAVAALTGLASFVYEIAWIRMLSLVLGASTHAFELMLAAFIFGLAAGGAFIRNRIDRIRDPQSFLGHVQVWMGVAAILTLPLYGSVFDLFAWLLAGLARSDPGYALFQVVSASVALTVMLPATFLAGMTLPLITYRLIAAGSGERAIGSVYAANTVGAIAGVIVAVHVLMPTLGVKGTLVGGALVDILLGVWLLRRPRGELAFSWPGFATVIAGLGVLGVVAAASDVDPRRAASGVYREGFARLSEQSNIVFHADGKTATVTVVEGNGRRLLRTNGKTDASMALAGEPSPDEPTQALLGALAVGANPQAKRAAVIGVGSGMTTAALLASPAIQRVDTIEIERRMVDGAKRFSDRNGAVWSDERSRFVFDDAKAWLARSTQPYDIVVSEPSNPWVSGVASLFTVETYARIAKHLAPNGVLVQWMPIYETDGEQLSSTFRALATHFPHYVVYKGGPADALVVASRDRRPSVDAAALFADRTMAKLLADAGVRSPSDVDTRWRGDASVFNALLAAYDAPPNSDYRPYVDQRSQRTRFLVTNFQPLFEASLGPTAMLEVLGAATPRTAGAENALGAALAAAVALPAGANASLPPAHASYADAVRATRELFVTCRPGGPVAVLVEGAVGTAMAINDLPAARAQAVWNGVRDGACYRSLDPASRLWIDLFAAIAARDAGAMSEFGGAALSAAPSDFVRSYALSAAVTGDIALGRPELGAARLDTFAGSQQSAWLTLLREASAGRTIAPANGRGAARQAAAK